MTAGPSVETRRLDIDQLRNAIVLSLIVFHTARLFNRQPWHIKDALTYREADIAVALLDVPSMPLLFMLAGASAFFALRRRGVGQFLLERVRRLFVPLVFGILALVTPQVYVERISPEVPGRHSPIDFTGSYLDFLPGAFGCCYPAANLSWHHLWFLAYLMAYAVVLAPVFQWLSTERGRTLVARLTGLVAPGWRIFLVALPIVAIELALRRRFPSTHDLAADWANHAHYIFLMVVGWCVASSAGLDDAIKRNRIVAAIGTVALIVAWFSMPRGFPATALAIRMAAEWFSLVALLGLARVHLGRPIPFLAAFTRHALPFYLVHQTVIVLLGWALFSWSGEPLAKFAAVAVLSLVISYGLARAADLSAPTRFLFGMPLSVPPRTSTS